MIQGNALIVDICLGVLTAGSTFIIGVALVAGICEKWRLHKKNTEAYNRSQL